MRSKVIVLIVWLFSFATAHAQEQIAPIIPQKLRYEQRLPASVRRLMPHGAKSRFFGRFQLAEKGPQYAAHFYDPTPKKGNAFDTFNGNYRIMLNIFEARSRSRWQRINHQALNYKTHIWAPQRYAAHLLWLDPASRKQPILKLDSWAPEAELGPIGDEILVVFSTGLKGKAATQSFRFGNWRASDTAGQTNTFGSTDKRGLLQVDSTIGVMGPDPSDPPEEQDLAHNVIITWTWNGKAFIPNKKVP
jgi:hypothetical protein